jgi:DnaD/phage-associated family protein
MHRSIEDSAVWSNASWLKMWILILNEVAYTEPARQRLHGREKKVHRGQWFTSRENTAFLYNKDCKPAQQISQYAAWRIVFNLKALGMLLVEKVPGGTVITVINWNDYQKTAQETAQESPEKRPETDAFLKKLRSKEQSATAAVSAENPFTFYQENGFGMLNGINAEQIQGWVDDFENAGSPEPTAMVIKAMQTAVDRNKVSWGYARGILSNWDRRNIRSLAAVEADQKSYEAKQVSNGRSKQPPKLRENFDREYTEDDGNWNL